jgi:diguanylate cyclase (GGDEF)-like protein
MNTNRKILLIVTLMLIALTAATIINVGLNFRDYAYNNAIEKSKMTAEIVRDGLTAHMVNGIMDKRDFFLRNIAMAKDVEGLWIVRSKKVTDQFGEGLVNERPRDEIDTTVLESGEEFRQIIETADEAKLRVTIPYVATAYSSPNCLECHNVQEGDVLGAISLEFNVESIRDAGTITIAKIFGINLLFIIIAVWVTNHYIRPYMSLFSNLQEGIKRAHRGDFKHRFTTTVSGEGAEVTEQINTLFTKMQETFGEVRDNLNSFVARNNISCSDPLFEAKSIIRELGDVYKFKKTIELDASKEAIYERIIYVLKHKFEIDHFAFYEVKKDHGIRELIYITEGETFCSSKSHTNINACRAQRTNSDVISTDFADLCESCEQKEYEYLCIPFNINEDVSLVISISSKSKESIEEINIKSSSIKNYLEAAKPVIESKFLMERLRDTSLRDGMTGLYNRRFLEEFIDKVMNQTLREDGKYSIMMLDIDYFKIVNDTYGHDAGDTIIKGLSEVINETIRKADLAIRYGGEEFVVLLHNATRDGALEVAQKIHDKFNERKFRVGSAETIQKTISIGLAHFPEDADSIWKVIKFADTALYEAKNTGRNQVIEFKSEMFESEEY